MKREEVCQLIKQIAIIPAIRVSSAEEAHYAAETVTAAGIPIVEITMTVPEAVELISHLVTHHKKMIVGAGTVLDTETAKRCVDAGASFITAPGFDPAVVDFSGKAGVAAIPGALTPTEVINAWKAGADFVKVFPSAAMGGHKYIKALKTALPQVPLIAAGGVTQQTAMNFILAGATALGVGSDLVPVESIERHETARIKELAHRFLGFVEDARERLGTQKETQVETHTDFSSLHKRR
jgi:2-dehydro-3-deoxyphosphogluconate aldolase / (4S)-4-hydroxy-2-oxoglutarate aldolase